MLPFHPLHFSLFDSPGSLLGLTDSNGTLVATYQYDPSDNLTSTTGSVNNPWRFASGYLDSSTGLYKFGARYYDPTIGRWTQQDPVGGNLSDPTSLNRYVYVSDDPVNLVDLSGRGDCVFAILRLIAILIPLVLALPLYFAILAFLYALPFIGGLLASLFQALVGYIVGHALKAFWNSVVAPACGFSQVNGGP